MNTSNYVVEGGAILFLLYLVIKEVVIPLVRGHVSDGGNGQAAIERAEAANTAHAVMLARLESEENARRHESEILREMIDKMNDTVIRNTEVMLEVKLTFNQVLEILKKGNGFCPLQKQ